MSRGHMSAVSKLKNDEMYYGEFGQKWLSNSDISTLLNNPAMFRKGKSDSKALIMGRYFHWAILEPEKAETITCVEATTRSTKVYKEATRDGNIAMLCHEKDQVDEMVKAIKSNFDFFEGIYEDGNIFETPEVGSLFGLPWKGKADILSSNRIIDLKTTSGISSFRNSAYKFNYDSQAYIYQHLFGVPMEFWVIDKNTLAMGMFHCSDEFLRSGEQKVKAASEIYNRFFGESSTESIENHYIVEEL
tara:strand:- start:16941 stop:17678 length:738 start_codon:yes stop_codon:yes gene_type:complete